MTKINHIKTTIGATNIFIEVVQMKPAKNTISAILKNIHQRPSIRSCQLGHCTRGCKECRKFMLWESTMGAAPPWVG